MARMIPKRLLVLGLGCTLVVCTLYYLLTLSPSIPSPLYSNMLYSLSPANTTQASLTHESCSSIKKYPADIETADMFPTLELEPEWMERREYWGSQMEDRYVEEVEETVMIAVPVSGFRGGSLCGPSCRSV